MVEEDILDFLIKNASSIGKTIRSFSGDVINLQPNSSVRFKHGYGWNKKLRFIIICDGQGNFKWFDHDLLNLQIPKIVQAAIDGKISADDASKLIETLFKNKSPPEP